MGGGVLGMSIDTRCPDPQGGIPPYPLMKSVTYTPIPTIPPMINMVNIGIILLNVAIARD